MVQIDKDIPIPDDDRGRYPLRTMEVGDSFALDNQKDANSVRASSYRIEGKKFVVKKLAAGSWRCWRTA